MCLGVEAAGEKIPWHIIEGRFGAKLLIDKSTNLAGRRQASRNREGAGGKEGLDLSNSCECRSCGRPLHLMVDRSEGCRYCALMRNSLKVLWGGSTVGATI
ncbi:hypothetical protein MHYP_G00183910 [Metynnis hypsauchen]